MATGAIPQQSRNRAEVTAGTDNKRRFPGVIDDPVAVFTNDGFDRRGQLFRSVDAAEQVVVKFTPANTIADYVAVIVLHGRLAHHPDAKPPDGLQGSPAGVFLRVNAQGLHHGRRNPACAGFVPGEILFINDQHFFAAVFEGAGQGGSGRAGSNDDQVVVVHQASSGAAGKS